LCGDWRLVASLEVKTFSKTGTYPRGKGERRGFKRPDILVSKELRYVEVRL